jgi:hypothetical protein
MSTLSSFECRLVDEQGARRDVQLSAGRALGPA